MTDIVERLEDASNAAGNVFEGIFQDSKQEIERLRAEIAELRKAQGEPVARYFEQYPGQPIEEIDEKRFMDTPEDCRFKLYTSALSIPEGWLKICADELERSTLTSLPRKAEFARKHGLSGVEDVHVWMSSAHSVFKKMVETTLAETPKGN